MICLDTNVAIGVLNDRPRVLVERFDRLSASGLLALPAIVVFELAFGVVKSAKRRSSEERLSTLLAIPVQVLDFCREDAWEAADIRAHLRRAGTPIGPYDVLIAAQARRRDATLVTANTREFARVPALRLDDWTQP